MPRRSSVCAEGVANGLFPSLFSAFLDPRLGLWAWRLCSHTARVPRTPSQPFLLPNSPHPALPESVTQPPRSLAGWPPPDWAPGKRPKLAEPEGATRMVYPRDRPSPKGPALHLLSKFDGVAGEPRPKLGVQVGSGGNLDHLLMPPLDGTVSLIQVQNVSVLVSYSERETQLLQGSEHPPTAIQLRGPVDAHSQQSGQPGQKPPPPRPGP